MGASLRGCGAPIRGYGEAVGSAGEVIALFPLSHVLLPGLPLPLHIFEQRYRDLIADVTSTARPASFGVVALRTGTEALTPLTRDTGPDVERVGTLAEILELAPHPDGTYDVFSVGSRRFEIRNLVLEGTAYLRAEVDFLDEQDGDLAEADVTRARELFSVYDTALTRLAGRRGDDDLPTDPNQLSYQLAARLPLAPAERQTLLADPTAAQRLHRVAALLRRELALLQRTRTVAIAPAALGLVTGAN
jgi:Lon protease-like protein